MPVFVELPPSAAAQRQHAEIEVRMHGKPVRILRAPLIAPR